MAQSIGHGQHGQAEGQGDAVEPDPDMGKAAARTALPQPPKTSQKVPRSSASVRWASGIRSSCVDKMSRRCQTATGGRTEKLEQIADYTLTRQT